MGGISSGAAGDIKHVTKLARHMVCDWGMSDMGPIAYGENSDTVFLGREISRSENFSEDTARKIDAEVRKIVDEQYARATAILTERRAALDGIAEALLQYETIEGKHVMEIINQGAIISPVVHTLPPVLEEKPGKTEADNKPSATDLPAAGSAPATA